MSTEYLDYTGLQVVVGKINDALVNFGSFNVLGSDREASQKILCCFTSSTSNVSEVYLVRADGLYVYNVSAGTLARKFTSEELFSGESSTTITAAFPYQDGQSGWVFYTNGSKIFKVNADDTDSGVEVLTLSNASCGVYYSGDYYIGTFGSGLYKITSILSSPTSEQVSVTGMGASINTFLVVSGTLYVGNSGDLCFFDGSNWGTHPAASSSMTVRRNVYLGVFGDYILARSADGYIGLLTSDDVISLYSSTMSWLRCYGFSLALTDTLILEGADSEGLRQLYSYQVKYRTDGGGNVTAVLYPVGQSLLNIGSASCERWSTSISGYTALGYSGGVSYNFFGTFSHTRSAQNVASYTALHSESGASLTPITSAQIGALFE